MGSMSLLQFTVTFAALLMLTEAMPPREEVDRLLNMLQQQHDLRESRFDDYGKFEGGGYLPGLSALDQDDNRNLDGLGGGNMRTQASSMTNNKMQDSRIKQDSMVNNKNLDGLGGGNMRNQPPIQGQPGRQQTVQQSNDNDKNPNLGPDVKQRSLQMGGQFGGKFGLRVEPRPQYPPMYPPMVEEQPEPPAPEEPYPPPQYNMYRNEYRPRYAYYDPVESDYYDYYPPQQPQQQRRSFNYRNSVVRPEMVQDPVPGRAYANYGDHYYARSLDPMGGGMVRNLDSLGGGNLVRNLDSLGGGNLVRNLDSLGGGNLVRNLDSLGGGNMVRNLDSLGGGNMRT